MGPLARPHFRRSVRAEGTAEQRHVVTREDVGDRIRRIVPQAGYKQTAPAGGFHTITLGAGGTVSNKNFGEKRLK